jgi:hypothetical protein
MLSGLHGACGKVYAVFAVLAGCPVVLPQVGWSVAEPLKCSSVKGRRGLAGGLGPPSVLLSSN